MIQTGDRFSSKDLAQSINELCDGNMHKFLDKCAHDIAIGNSLIKTNECTPDEYATICIDEYNDIPSSAVNLDNQLRDGGFKTTFRFAYNYRTPGIAPQQIIRDAYRLDWFRQIYTTGIPKTRYQNEYFTLLDAAFRTSYYYAQYLWTFNRPACNKIAGQLRMPDPYQWEQIISAILGIGFQFHPRDVYEYSIEHINPMKHNQFSTQYDIQLKFKNEMKTKFGIDTGCLVLSPKNREKLQKIVTDTDTPYWLQCIANLIPGYNR